MTEHRLLTVRQPWARPIVDGHKRTENRSTGFTRNYRGPLWIHAGATWSDRGLASDLIHDAYPDAFPFAENGFTRGAVIGRVEVVDAHHSEPGCCPDPWAEQSYTDARGRRVAPVVHLELDHPVALPAPIPHRVGRLGLWRPDPDLALELDEVLR